MFKQRVENHSSEQNQCFYKGLGKLTSANWGGSGVERTGHRLRSKTVLGLDHSMTWILGLLLSKVHALEGPCEP